MEIGDTMLVTIWHLEITDPAQFVPSDQVRRYTLQRIQVPAPEFTQFLYEAVGREWHWVDRATWTREDWLHRLTEPGIETWVAWEKGAPLGYFELVDQGNGTVELAYFGLLPHTVGQGQGGALLNDAIGRAWVMGAKRIYVNTCSLDHPSALDNYKARGFALFRTEQRERAIPGAA